MSPTENTEADRIVFIADRRLSWKPAHSCSPDPHSPLSSVHENHIPLGTVQLAEELAGSRVTEAKQQG